MFSNQKLQHRPKCHAPRPRFDRAARWRRPIGRIHTFPTCFLFLIGRREHGECENRTKNSSDPGSTHLTKTIPHFLKKHHLSNTKYTTTSSTLVTLALISPNCNSRPTVSRDHARMSRTNRPPRQPHKQNPQNKQ